MSKKLVISILLVAITGVILVNFLPGFGKNKGPVQADPAFGAYITAYTSGIISNESGIRIILATETAKPVEIGKKIEEKLFGFSPEIKGAATWLDSRTIEFKPEQRLPSGQLYEAEFYLKKLVEPPSEFSEFRFGFQVMEQSFDVELDGMTTTDRQTLRWQRLKGTLSTADGADEKTIEKLVTAAQGSKPLKLTWEHRDKLFHTFFADSIERKEKAGDIQLKWDGEALGIHKTGSEKISIPSLKDFKLLDIKVIQAPEQYISLQFSDPIQEKQNLDGIITLAGTGVVKFIIEDNEVRVYPQSRLNGPKTIRIETGVKNILGFALKAWYSRELMFEEIKPQVRIQGKGVILPSSNGLVFPFEAVSLRAVDVKIVRIFENNIPQFLQVNSLDGSDELSRVGKVILKKSVQLTTKSAFDLGRWNTYYLDLAELIKTEPGAIYKIYISFKKKYSTYACSGTIQNDNELQEIEEETDEDENWERNRYSNYYYDSEYYYYDDGDYEYEEYDYSQRDNPCHSTYYRRNRTVSRSVLASDLGLIAKRGSNGNVQVILTDLKTAQPVSGAEIIAYDFQQQVMADAKTNAEGIAVFSLKKKPFLIIAKNMQQRGYLKLEDGASLSLSMFDVSGETVEKGIKGFIFGERGVWRPGDTLFLSFMLEDKQNLLPKNHPVVFELINPRGQIVKKIIRNSSLNNFYNFTTNTDEDAPTGNYTARVKVGATLFTKTLKIETVMPNRLKILFDFGVSILSAENKNTEGKLEVKWLHGAIARNLKTKIEVGLSTQNTRFPKYDGYIFDDPARNFNAENQLIYDGNIDENGKAMIKPEFEISDAAPGMLNANFTLRVFEEGGAFSIDRFSLPYSPYPSYVGIKSPEGNKFTHMLHTDTNHTIQVATVDEKGAPVSRQNLKVRIYKVDWRWWWERSHYNDLASYVGNNYHKPFREATVSTVNGKGQFTFRVDRPEWGRFFIHVSDEESGHSTGATIYVDWPWWRGTSPKGNEGASMLSFNSDKPKYNVGENAKLTIPSSAEGKALISIENGSRVLQTHWLDIKKEGNNFSFPVTAEMTPNVFVNVSLIQPHGQVKNDLPIRMYGVIPIQVEDPNTHLYPIIKTADVWRPEEKANVTVSEKNGKDMTYSIAVVDEGLLDLTRFKTPDPWIHFYAREALGVKTWDLFDQVIGAYGAKLERILAIGGDGDVDRKGNKKANRFKPMVKFLGPFHLKKGETQTHSFLMPQYVGSVRVMVVGEYNAAYGSSDKAVPVRKPLMLLATLPRVLGPGETVDLPVNVFAMEKHIKSVDVEVQTGNHFTLLEGGSKNVKFSQVGDEVVNFKMKVNSQLGIGKVKVTAKSGNEKAVYEIELDVRNPNPKIISVIEAVVDAGKSWITPYSPVGMAGTNKATLELSSIPPINLEKRLRYLISYPHGCVEQTTSAAFPQLFLSDLMEMDSYTKGRVENNIKAAIDRLKSFQHVSGGMSYWPGGNETSDWGTNYAGHFLLEADAKGFSLPNGMLENWKQFQRSRALSWTPNYNRESYYSNDDLIQAYRLYTLSIARSPELGAMNRLREYRELSPSAKWMLAAAYAKAGQPETSKKIIASLPTTIKEYHEMGYSYGSHTRDEAIILETLSLLGERNKAMPVLKKISEQLSRNEWLSTQTTAYCLIAVSKFVKSGGGKSASITCTYKINGTEASLNTQLPLSQKEIKIKGTAGGNVEVNNSGQGILFARIVLEGIPETGDPTNEESDLGMNIRYTTMDGKDLNPERLEQGTDFIAEVTVTHPGVRSRYQQMALSQVFPSGWEIRNSRMDESLAAIKSALPTYQDIRDDRVYTYFDISPRENKVFRIVLNASYTGKFYLPTLYCEAMYDNSVRARKAGKWVEVVRAGLVN